MHSIKRLRCIQIGHVLYVHWGPNTAPRIGIVIEMEISNKWWRSEREREQYASVGEPSTGIERIESARHRVCTRRLCKPRGPANQTNIKPHRKALLPSECAPDERPVRSERLIVALLRISVEEEEESHLQSADPQDDEHDALSTKSSGEHLYSIRACDAAINGAPHWLLSASGEECPRSPAAGVFRLENLHIGSALCHTLIYSWEPSVTCYLSPSQVTRYSSSTNMSVRLMLIECTTTLQTSIPRPSRPTSQDAYYRERMEEFVPTVSQQSLTPRWKWRSQENSTTVWCLRGTVKN